jgi:hypothetical protein
MRIARPSPHARGTHIHRGSACPEFPLHRAAIVPVAGRFAIPLYPLSICVLDLRY